MLRYTADKLGYVIFEVFHTGEFLFIEFTKKGSVTFPVLVAALIAVLKWAGVLTGLLILFKISWTVLEFGKAKHQGSINEANLIECIKDPNLSEDIRGACRKALEDSQKKPTGGIPGFPVGGGTGFGLGAGAGIAIVLLLFAMSSRRS